MTFQFLARYMNQPTRALATSPPGRVARPLHEAPSKDNELAPGQVGLRHNIGAVRGGASFRPRRRAVPMPRRVAKTRTYSEAALPGVDIVPQIEHRANMRLRHGLGIEGSACQISRSWNYGEDIPLWVLAHEVVPDKQLIARQQE